MYISDFCNINYIVLNVQLNIGSYIFVFKNIIYLQDNFVHNKLTGECEWVSVFNIYHKVSQW